MPPKVQVDVRPVPKPLVHYNSALYNFLIIDLPRHLHAIVGAQNQEQHGVAIHRLRSVLLDLIRTNAISCAQLEQNKRKVLNLCKAFPPGAVHCPQICSTLLGQATHFQQLRETEAALHQLTGEGFYLHSLLSTVTADGKYREETVQSGNCCQFFSQGQPGSVRASRSGTPWQTPPLPTTPSHPSTPPLSPTASPATSLARVTTPGPLVGVAKGKKTLVTPTVVVHTTDIKDEVCDI